MYNKTKVLSEKMNKLRENLKDSTIFINVSDNNGEIIKILYKILNDINYCKVKLIGSNNGYFINIDSDYQNRASDFWGRKNVDIIIEGNFINFKENFYTFNGEELEICKPNSVDIEKYLSDIKRKDMWLKRIMYKVLRQDVPPEDKQIDIASFSYKKNGNKIKIKLKSQEL